MKGFKRNIIVVTILSFGLMLSINACSQNSPADEYYNNNIPKKTPSQTYYDNYLRSTDDEWEEDEGPGGSGNGGNTGVGVPVGELDLSVIICIIIYGGYSYIQKKRITK